MDATGFIFAPAPQFSAHVFLTLEGGLLAGSPLGQQPIPAANFTQLLAVRQWLQAAFASTTLADFGIYRALKGEAADYVLLAEHLDFPERTFRIILSLNQDLNLAGLDAVSALNSPALESSLNQPGLMLDYLDLRFDPKIFYKFKPLLP